MPRRSTSIAAWCLFDWAVTPYPTIVTTFIFSTYFATKMTADPVIGSAQWSFMVAVAGVAIALLSPPLGAIADRMGHAKRGIAFFTLITALAGALLWFARPGAALALPVLIVAGCGIVAFELGLLFYNALLPRVAPPLLLGRVSGWGWAAGYGGGLGCLILALLFLINPELSVFGIPKEAYPYVRACGPLIALWIVAFAWPLFAFVPDVPRTGLPLGAALRQGLGELRGTIASLRGQKQLLRFLIASAIYRDGVTTILTIGGLYARVSFGMTLSEVIVFGIGLQVTAGLGAAIFAWLDDWIGSKRTIMLSLLGLILFGAAIIAVRDKAWFLGLGLALGVFVGPAQAASRSMVVRLAPSVQIAQFFGLYALTGRAVTFVGPLLFGIATEAAHSQRTGLGVILMLLVVGLVLLLGVKEQGAAAETARS